MSSYYLMRNHIGDEPIGIITLLSWPPVEIRKYLFEGVDIEVGYSNWWLDNISKSEFETYKEFGFKEYSINED